MQSRVVGQFVRGVNSRAPLVLVGKRGNVIETETVVQCQAGIDAPFVLHIQARQISNFALIVDDGNRYVAALRPSFVGCEYRHAVVTVCQLPGDSAAQPDLHDTRIDRAVLRCRFIGMGGAAGGGVKYRE